MNEYIDSAGWVHCPICGSKTRIKVYPETKLVCFPLFCPKCKREQIVNIQDEKFIQTEPDAKTQSQ